MQINTKGITGSDLCKIAAIVAALLIGWRFLDARQASVSPAAPSIDPSEYVVEFWADDGSRINVEPLPPGGQQ